jgi:transposase, IS5 family
MKLMQGNLEGKPIKSSRKRAVTSKYISPNQLTLCGFETPFEQQLSTDNRWVKLSQLIPWDKIVQYYDVQFKSTEGRPPINGRVILGAVIIKHILDLTDRETIFQIRENMFMQYFLGFSTFSNDEPFSHTMFSTIRARLNLEIMEKINEVIILHSQQEKLDEDNTDKIDHSDVESEGIEDTDTTNLAEVKVGTEQAEQENRGNLLMDATVAPQYITYPTDLKLLNASRKKTEQIIDKLYDKKIHAISKPRTYRKIARKEFLNTAKKKSKSYKEIYRSNGRQLRFVARNLKHIEMLLAGYHNTAGFIKIPLDRKDYEYIDTIKEIYAQQYQMHSTRTNTIEDRIVNLHQPYVRPIVRGKEGRKVEFGSKLQVSLVDGFALLDKLSWDNFNESTCLKDSVQKYKTRFGFYPKNVLADRIYCTRENRAYLKSLNINLKAKPLGRPSNNVALSNQVSPGERNPVEGKFGQAKVAYGLDKIKAKLQCTSESWVASILFVLNLVNLTRRALASLLQHIFYNKCNFVRLRQPSV